MSATIRDVAKLAGVSASTVSRVINKSAPISGETTERIYRAMEELKYVPNDIARSFASGNGIFSSTWQKTSSSSTNTSHPP